MILGDPGENNLQLKHTRDTRVGTICQQTCSTSAKLLSLLSYDMHPSTSTLPFCDLCPPVHKDPISSGRIREWSEGREGGKEGSG